MLGDKKVIEYLRKGERLEDLALEALYRQNQRMVQKMVLNNGGTAAQGHEVLHQAIIVFYEKVKKNGFEQNAKISTYLYRVAQNIWWDEVKKRSREQDLSLVSMDGSPPEIIEQLLREERRQLVTELFDALKEDCQRILRLSIYEEKTMAEIGKEMGFKNEQNTRNKKNKCLNYLRKIIRDRPYLSSKFNELS